MRKEIECEVFGINTTAQIEYSDGFVNWPYDVAPKHTPPRPERIHLRLRDLPDNTIKEILYLFNSSGTVSVTYKDCLLLFYLSSGMFLGNDVDIEGVLTGKIPDFI